MLIFVDIVLLSKGNKSKDMVNLHEKVSRKYKFLTNFISK